MKDLKVNLTPEDFCSNLPKEVLTFFNYCRDLEFDQSPDYSYLRQLLKTVVKQRKEQYDAYYDWNIKKLGK